MKESSQILVEIRTPAEADPPIRAFVVGLASAVRPEMYRKLRTAEQRYLKSTRKWRSDLVRIRENPSNAILRWKLSNDIEIFFHALERDLGFFVTNKREALLRDLTLSKSDLGYTLRMAERFDLREVQRSGLKWSRFRELLDFKDEHEMNRCMQLILAGKIRTNEEIRAFHRMAKTR